VDVDSDVDGGIIDLETCVQYGGRLQRGGGGTWRACTPSVGGEINSRIRFPPAAIVRTAHGDMMLESEQAKIKMDSAMRCIA